MRRIARYATHSEAAERAAFLRAHGVAARVTDSSSLARAALVRNDPSRASLWVLLDDQEADALALLEDPEHRVAQPLSEADMQALETEGAAAVQQRLLMIMLALAGGGLLLALLLSGGAG